MGFRMFKEKLSSFLEEGRQITIVVVERKKIWLTICTTVLIVISIVFFQDGIDLWKEANLPPAAVEDDLAEIGDLSTTSSYVIKKDKSKERTIEDISDLHNCRHLETSMQRINEPVIYGNEIIYSAGESNNIENQAILTDLFLYDMENKEELAIAGSGIKFGEIYEARFNERWVTWLDTNHIGSNIIYGMDRETEEVIEIKTCEHNKPQLRLWGDNLIWTEQGDLEKDILYLYNFVSGEPVVLETFDSTTYGISPPSIWNDVIVWAVPGKNGGSLLKKMNLKGAGTVSTVEILQEIIDPKGFAIYPSTNGEVIAWIDNLDPQEATLKLMVDGEEIIDVAKGVGRLFGVGDNFVGYTQDNNIILYFWEDERYASINPRGTHGRLSQCSISGDTIIWYSNPPKESQDIVNISTIE